MTQWQEVETKLAKLNLDPHRLACGCAVKIDLQRVVYPALRAIRPELEKLGLQLAEREDADIVPLSEDFSFERRVNDFSEKAQPLPPGAHRAVTVTSAYRVSDPEVLGKRWLALYQALLKDGATLRVGKGHTIEAYSPNDEFVHFDLYQSLGKPCPGWRVVNNDTIQLIDPTRDFGAPEQTEVALCNALNDLFCLGAVEDIRVYPLYAAPGEALAKRIEGNVEAFCNQHGFEHIPQPSISGNTLLIGATVFGASSRQLPTHYDQLRKGDEILVHRPFGDLAPINVLIENMILGNGNLAELNLDRAALQQIVDRRIEVLRRPNLDVGRLIQQFSPEVDEPFEPNRHLKATGDLSGPGIDIFRELAELSGHTVILEKIPLAEEAVVRYASAHYLLPNGTAGTNGAIMAVGSAKVIQNFKAELETLGHNPHVIGRIGEAGDTLTVPPETKDYIPNWPSAYRLDKSEKEETR